LKEITAWSFSLAVKAATPCWPDPFNAYIATNTGDLTGAGPSPPWPKGVAVGRTVALGVDTLAMAVGEGVSSANGADVSSKNVNAVGEGDSPATSISLSPQIIQAPKPIIAKMTKVRNILMV